MGDSTTLRAMALNLGGRAVERIPVAAAMVPGLEMYGFLETMHNAGNCGDLDFLAEGYRAWHCVRPAPAQGRQHGGVSVYVRRDLLLHGGCRVRCDEDTGIVWVSLLPHQLTVAFCYFSPSSSPVYTQGFLHADPVQSLLDGVHRLTSRGQQVIIMGDMNIRVGGLSWDVPDVGTPLPPFLQSEALLPAEADLEGIPRSRTTMDMAVPNADAAQRFVEGLCSARLVMLNGRAPVPAASAMHGVAHPSNDALTCHAQGGPGGSVVDLALVSRGLFSKVSSLEVLPFKPCISRDHSALVLHMELSPSNVAPPGGRVRRQPVCRPERDRYATALANHAHCFQALLESWQQSGVTVAEAHSQFTNLMRRVSRASEGSDTEVIAARRGDQPWFDADCHAAKATLQQACVQVHNSRGGRFGGGEVDPGALAALQAARRTYKALIASKREAYRIRQQVDMIKAYFSRSQRDYWRVLFGRKPTTCPIADVAEWTEWFSSLLGAQPPAADLTEAQQNLKQQLYQACRRLSQDEMAVLNEPLTVDEVASAMRLAPGRAADLQGLTGEAVRVAAEKPEEEEEFVCRPFVECMQWLLQLLLDGSPPPDVMCTSKLAPVPKSGQAQAPSDKNMYRGVSVSEVVAKVWDRVMYKRFDGVVEGNSLRAPTQCGFRAEHGTIDALFTMQHLIDKSRASHSPLYVVFVDFKKAFDLVQRDLLIERCRELGVHGAFLQCLIQLYDRVLLRVSVDGDTGEAFATHMGTKQGSELSPLMFGLFIELLHELIKLQAPGAGPLLSTMRVPDILYADDCALIGQSTSDCQQLLNILDAFCQLFGMQVNLAPHKTCAVVFRPATMEVPPDCHFTFQGQDVPMQDTYIYLGVLLHATQGLARAPPALAASGRRALQAMLGQLRRAFLSQFDIRCRMFDILVEPVMSYGCHVWGPAVFHNRLASRDRPVFMSEAEKVHLHFLRMMTGTGKSCVDVMLRDMHRAPVMHHWVVLAARLWTKLAAMPLDQPSMAREAWLSDIALMRGSETGGRMYTKCWSYRLLHTLQQIGAISAADWNASADLTALQFEEGHVKSCLAACMHARWASVLLGDPRLAPSAGLEKVVHANWVYVVSPDVDCTDRHSAPPHMVLCMPTKHLRVLAQLRLGWAHLQVELGRRQRHPVPRNERVCRVCCGVDSPAAWRQHAVTRAGAHATALGVVEDLRHFLLECPAYDPIRTSSGILPPNPWAIADPGACMRALFSLDDQSAVARMLFAMKSKRARLLDVPL